MYRAQFWHTNRVGGIFWLAGVVLFLNVLTVAGTTAAASPVHAVLLVLASLAGLGTLAAAATAVALCSRYRDSVSSVWRTALVLPLVSPLMSLSLLATLAAAVVVFSALPVLVPLVGASLPLLAVRLAGGTPAGRPRNCGARPTIQSFPSDPTR